MKEDMAEYMYMKMHEYVDDRVTDSKLWEAFKEDFNNFDNAAWKQFDRKVI
jgi:hypothetical protein